MTSSRVPGTSPDGPSPGTGPGGHRGLDACAGLLGGDGVVLPDVFTDAMEIEDGRIRARRSASSGLALEGIERARTSSGLAKFPASASATAFLISSMCQRLTSR